MSDGDRPNVLLILTDQHRLDAVGCYAETPCRTPNVDRLAEEGVRFETAYTTSPVCTPARGSIATGQFPHGHGLTGNVGNQTTAFHTLPDTPDVLPRRLDRAGYDLGYTGKWHLSPPSGELYGRDFEGLMPSDLGFEGHDVPGHGGGGWEMPAYEDYLEEHGYSIDLTERPGETPYGRRSSCFEGPTEATVPYFLTEHAIEMLEEFRQREDPFFHWLNFWGPHPPHRPSREFLDLYRDVDVPPWPNFEWPADETEIPARFRRDPDAETFEWDDWAEAVRYYYAFTSMIDAQIGRLLDYMTESGFLEDTVVIFAADHGATVGSHGGMVDKGFSHFEEIMRIPLIVRFPDGRWAGTDREDLVSLADVYPTILDVADAPRDRSGEHGRSLLDLLEEGTADWRDAVHMEFQSVAGMSTLQRTVRAGDLKYGWNAAGRDELYDLSIDPNETRNLIDHPEYEADVERLRRRMREWMDETGDGVSNAFRFQTDPSFWGRGDGSGD
jgi:arylsulfatase A-like enzyme